MTRAPRPPVVVLLTLLCAASSVRAQEEDERARREAEIFGAPADEADDADADDSDDTDAEAAEDDQIERPEELTEEDAPASPLQEIVREETEAADVLRDLERALDIGGRAYLALQYSVSGEGTPLFPPLTSPSLLDLYADARPSQRVRAYAQARLDYDFTAIEGREAPETGAFGFVRPSQELRLDQLWLKLDAGRVAYLTLGKQRIRWGTGRFWNPTDFLNTQVRDPLDVFDRRLGVNLAKVHFPLEDLGSNLYVIGDFEGATRIEEPGLAVRAEAAVATTEVSTSASVRRGEPLRFGADISSGVWVFDLRAEGAATFNSDQPFFEEGDVDLGRGVVPDEVSRADEWLLQLVLGGEVAIPYSSTDYVLVGAEYFYNDAGYEDPDLYPLLFTRGAFRPLYVGRHYAAAYLIVPQPGDLNDASFVISNVGNLSDQSFLTRVDFSTLVLTFLTLNLWVSTHYGNEGELRLGLDLPPLPGVPGAEDGIRAAAPIVDVGGALTLSF